MPMERLTLSDIYLAQHHPDLHDDRVVRLPQNTPRAEYTGGQVERGEAGH